MRINATIEMIPNKRAAIVECHDQHGAWKGSLLVESPLRSWSLSPNAPSGPEQDRAAIYEIAYDRASQNADAHGGTLNTIRWT
jgi:hypothetical protein